jgi:hypothetical protein
MTSFVSLMQMDATNIAYDLLPIAAGNGLTV